MSARELPSKGYAWEGRWRMNSCLEGLTATKSALRGLGP